MLIVKQMLAIAAKSATTCDYLQLKQENEAHTLSFIYYYLTTNPQVSWASSQHKKVFFNVSVVFGFVCDVCSFYL